MNQTHVPTARPSASQLNVIMATAVSTAVPLPAQIPMTNVAASSNTNAEVASSHVPEPAHVHRDTNADLEADPTQESNPAADDEALPAYKEEDMAEPLPPYMARVRQVMRGEQPISTVMPSKIVGRWIVGSFVLAVLIIIAVSIGVEVSGNKSGTNNNQ